jgi:hypothetical protein
MINHFIADIADCFVIICQSELIGTLSAPNQGLTSDIVKCFMGDNYRVLNGLLNSTLGVTGSGVKVSCRWSCFPSPSRL